MMLPISKTNRHSIKFLSLKRPANGNKIYYTKRSISVLWVKRKLYNLNKNKLVKWITYIHGSLTNHDYMHKMNHHTKRRLLICFLFLFKSKPAIALSPGQRDDIR